MRNSPLRVLIVFLIEGTRGQDVPCGVEHGGIIERSLR